MKDLDTKLHPNIAKAFRLAANVEDGMGKMPPEDIGSTAASIRATACCAADIVTAIERLRLAVEANTSAIKRPGVS